MEKFDIFVSYKYDAAGKLISRKIAADLQALGYRVYHNAEEVHSGDFRDRLEETIRQCRDFLLILTRDCLEQLLRHDKTDWVRQEVLWAEKYGLNIIPVFVEGVSMPKNESELPEDLRFLFTKDGVSLPVEYDQLPPLQVLLMKLHSETNRRDRYSDTYNSNPQLNVDALFLRTKEAAEAGSYRAKYELACMYYYGIGANGEAYRDYEAAFQLLQELAYAHNPDFPEEERVIFGPFDDEARYAAYAANLLARMYYGGFAPHQDQSYEKAFQYHKAASAYDKYAAQQYAFMLRIGSGCEQDYRGAEAVYQNAAARGDNLGYEGLAELYMATGRFNEAAALYEKMTAIVEGSAYKLGMLYKKGVLSDPPKPDYFKAAFYFSYSIEHDVCDPEVYYQLGALYFNPTGGFPKDFKMAEKYFTLAAEMGHANANYMLGFMYEYGHVKKDPAKAISCYEKAAPLEPLSCVHLAFLYQQPGFADYHKALKYARSAAERGVMEGEFAYGVMLLLGRGCEPDEHRASIYLTRARDHGMSQAEQFLELLEKKD